MPRAAPVTIAVGAASAGAAEKHRSGCARTLLWAMILGSAKRAIGRESGLRGGILRYLGTTKQEVQ